MKTKKNITTSAFEIFRQKSKDKNLSRIKKVKKKKPKMLNNDPPTESISEPQPSTSQAHQIPSESVVAPLLERDLRLIPCGNTEADKCFNWLINPVSPSEFYLETWEKKPLHIRNRKPQYYTSVFSCIEFDEILRNNHLEYEKNIDVVMYRNGERETYTADGRAYAAVIWDLFENGHSIRFLNPQTYSKPVWKLCSLLQEYFGSFVGCNMYLTPAGSQGFAPHYDDIEAFVLQIEGVKQWKVYSPRNANEILPRYSSGNFAQDEIGEPILEVELHPGDLLYFPRGFIHQAKTTESTHSLHLTLSTLQKTTWGDLLQKALPKALELAMENDVSYRESLPKDYMNYMGQAHVDKSCPEKEAFIRKVFSLTKNLVKYLHVDIAADMMTKEFIHGSHPPFLTRSEKETSIHGCGARWRNNKVCDANEIEPYSEIRLIRKRAVCLVREEETMRLYHSLENSRIYQEKDPQYVEIDSSYSPAVEYLLDSYPHYVTVEQLPLANLEYQMDLASLLYDKGLIRTRTALPPTLDEADP